MISSGCDDIMTEAETRSQRRRWLAVVTRRWLPLAGIAPVPFASSSHERSRQPLEEAYNKGMYHFRCGFSCCSMIAPLFFVPVVSDHFSNDSVATPINATGHQLVTLCRSICAEETSQILEPLRSSKNSRLTIHVCSLA